MHHSSTHLLSSEERAQTEKEFSDVIQGRLDVGLLFVLFFSFLAVHHLTDMSILLEDWDHYMAGLNDSKMTEYMFKYEKVLYEMRDLMNSDKAQLPQVPLGLINHIDLGLSPNPWLKVLFEDLSTENDVARGEARSIQAFRENLNIDESTPVDTDIVVENIDDQS